MDRRTYLKVKIKSLAEEARIIRKEERKARDTDLRNGLTDHRKNVVRTEARATLVAYGFLRGKTYRQIEPNTQTNKRLDWVKVKNMVQKYCDWQKQTEVLAAFQVWMKEATLVAA